MAANIEDTEMKVVNNINVENYRKLVQTYINLHTYHAALFWADKVVALSNANPKDVYWQAQCMFLLRQYHRAAHLLRLHNLDKTYILCNNLTVRCLLEANELTEALKLLNSMDLEVFLQHSTDLGPEAEAAMFDETPACQVKSSVLLLKGKVLEAMDNRGLAADCYLQALKADVKCYEAFDCLVQHHMLTAAEEEDLMKALPISEQCTQEEGDILLMLYRTKLKKYHTPSHVKNVPSIVKKNTVMPSLESNNVVSSFQDDINITPLQRNKHMSNRVSSFMGTINDIIFSTPNLTEPIRELDSNRNTAELKTHSPSNLYDSTAIDRLQSSLDMIVSKAEQLYYNYDYQRCLALTEQVLKQDPYHDACLPIHISCLVELKHSNKLFTLAHTLVDLYPNLAISWFAVGCYYYIIGKSDCARRYLAKANALDRLFGPAWLAYGHSFAVENEHDQAMAAYFKASQLMKGCHLPLMYIGLECGLTNNVHLAEKFFQQAKKIAPEDPFILHEMGVIAFQINNYEYAEKQFREALRIIKGQGNNLLSEQWGPLHNNLGHALRKQKKYDEALEQHHAALVLMPQNATIYSAIAFVHALMGQAEEAVDWFHRALGLRRDDTFSTTMLNYVIEQLAEEQEPYPDAPESIPVFERKNTAQIAAKIDINITNNEPSVMNETNLDASKVSNPNNNNTTQNAVCDSEISDMDLTDALITPSTDNVNQDSTTNMDLTDAGITPFADRGNHDSTTSVESPILVDVYDADASASGSKDRICDGKSQLQSSTVSVDMNFDVNISDSLQK